MLLLYATHVAFEEAWLKAAEQNSPEALLVCPCDPENKRPKKLKLGTGTEK